MTKSNDPKRGIQEKLNGLYIAAKEMRFECHNLGCRQGIGPINVSMGIFGGDQEEAKCIVQSHAWESSDTNWKM